MPFDPTFPASNIFLVSADFRAQFNGLFDLIQAIPAGPPGQQGIQGIPGQAGVNGQDGQAGVQGPAFAQAVVEAVNTLNPGDPAQVVASFDGTNVHFTFGIPRGQDGVSAPPVTSFIVDAVNTLNPGDPATAQATYDGTSVHFVFGIPRGSNGNDGGTGATGPGVNAVLVDAVNTLNPGDSAQAGVSFDGSTVRFTFGIPRGFNGNDGGIGPQGQQGPPFASAIVDSVTNLNPGETPTVGTSFDGSNVRFAFGIPRGFNGNDGGQGLQGPPGEVTSAQLANAIGGTSSNSNTVTTLDTPFANDPPTLADMEAMRTKFNELVLALRR